MPWLKYLIVACALVAWLPPAWCVDITDCAGLTTTTTTTTTATNGNSFAKCRATWQTKAPRDWTNEFLCRSPECQAFSREAAPRDALHDCPTVYPPGFAPLQCIASNVTWQVQQRPLATNACHFLGHNADFIRCFEQWQTKPQATWDLPFMCSFGECRRILTQALQVVEWDRCAFYPAWFSPYKCVALWRKKTKA